MRYSKIGSDLFKRNRQKLIGRMEIDSVAIFQSNDQMHRNGDQYYPYRQSSDLFYLSGIEQEMSVLIICPGADNPELLFIRKSDPKLETWEGRKLDLDTASEISGIKTVRWLDDLEKQINELFGNVQKIYTNVQELEKFKPEYPLRDERMTADLKRKFPKHGFKGLSPVMTELRMIKETEELDLIREAIRITRAGFDRVLGLVSPGKYEYEIEAELSYEFIRQGAEGHAYPPIIASGANACFLHYISNDQICREGDLLLMDFGAEYANYAADCSRTIPVNGRFTVRQKDLYEATHRVFTGARSMMNPGICIDDLNREVGKLWEKEHFRLGLYSLEDLKKQAKDDPLYRKYYPHGTSHFMGLDVHDLGSKQAVLQPGMVLTCEPGIYIPEEGTGIRLENDILITADGNLDLMEDFPMSAEEIEDLMN